MKSVEVKVNETLPTKHPLGRCVWSILWIMSFWRVLLESIFFWAFSKKANILQEFCVNHENPRNYELWNIYGSILRKLNYAKALDEQMYSNFNEAKIECSTLVWCCCVTTWWMREFEESVTELLIYYFIHWLSRYIIYACKQIKCLEKRARKAKKCNQNNHCIVIYTH